MYLGRSGFETLLRIRRLVLDRVSFPNIEFITGTVTDVRPDLTNPSRLNKVVVRTAAGVNEFESVLVADCTGPMRAGIKWLERSGYGYSSAYPGGKLPLDQLKISFDQKLCYCSIMFRITPEFHDRLPLPADMKNTGPIYTFLDEEVEQGRTLFALTRPDGNQFLVFTGHHGTVRSPPQNLAELKEYVRGLRAVEPIPDWVFEVLDMLEEVEKTAVVAIVKIPPTSYVRYHRGTNLPSNWVALGDSTMTLNPLFSEGCTKAFKEHQIIINGLRCAHDGAATRRKSVFWKIFALVYHATPASGYQSVGLASPIDAFNPNLVLKIFWRALLGGI
ncbi:hypothetical protein C8F04DRAFT_1186148 [Mycena alexandri]|uniref:Uncharacterized protein n=1 Tax=Mycena alexandri TaxID=1745969 RepID=A0AAD6SNP2_9AGAR|nr:hypothetical protein C8F04DRAFT_1186148 [Mycena alexandri]